MRHGEHAGHGARNKHAGHDPEAFRRQFWIVLALTIPTVIWSHEVQMWLGYRAPAFSGSEWIPAVLGTIVFCIGMYGALARRNAIGVLLSIELMLNGVNVLMVALDRKSVV